MALDVKVGIRISDVHVEAGFLPLIHSDIAPDKTAAAATCATQCTGKFLDVELPTAGPLWGIMLCV
jgi:hypothetical protein